CSSPSSVSSADVVMPRRVLTLASVSMLMAPSLERSPERQRGVRSPSLTPGAPSLHRSDLFLLFADDDGPGEAGRGATDGADVAQVALGPVERDGLVVAGGRDGREGGPGDVAPGGVVAGLLDLAVESRPGAGDGPDLLDGEAAAVAGHHVAARAGDRGRRRLRRGADAEDDLVGNV